MILCQFGATLPLIQHYERRSTHINGNGFTLYIFFLIMLLFIIYYMRMFASVQVFGCLLLRDMIIIAYHSAYSSLVDMSVRLNTLESRRPPFPTDIPQLKTIHIRPEGMQSGSSRYVLGSRPERNDESISSSATIM